MHARRLVIVTRIALIATLLLAHAASGQVVLRVKAGSPGGGNGLTWATAFSDLQLALAAVATSYPEPTRDVEIWVAAGTYTPSIPPQGVTGPRTQTFQLLTKTRIYGGFAGTESSRDQRDWFAHPSILSGDLAGDDGPGFQNISDNAVHVLYTSANDPTMLVDGVWIVGAAADIPSGIGEFRTNQGGGLLLDSSAGGGLTVRNCTFQRNTAIYGGGITTLGGVTMNVVNCRFLGNRATGQGAALYGSGLLVFGSVFGDNHALQTVDDRYGGGAITVSYNSRISSCSFWGNSALRGGAIWFFNPEDGNVTIENCAFQADTATLGGAEIYVPPGPFLPVLRSCLMANYPGDVFGQVNASNILTGGPSYAGPPGNLAPLPGSPLIDAGDTAAYQSAWGQVDADVLHHRRLYGAAVDIGAYESGAPPVTARLYVKADATGVGNGSSWGDALSGPLGLRDALDLATIHSGVYGEIWVAAGTYKPAGPGGSRLASFQVRPALPMYGGFSGTESQLSQRNVVANETILSGDLAGNDIGFFHNDENSFHIVNASGADASAVLDGFTITGGNANDAASGSPERSGGGMTATNAPVFQGQSGFGVRNCLFTGNFAVNGGGAVVLAYADPSFTDCVFASNRAGGESSEGGALHISPGSPAFRGCLFTGNFSQNSGGVVFAYQFGSSPLFLRCDFVANTAFRDGGLGVFANSGLGLPPPAPAFVNCRIMGNQALNGNGGALWYNWNCQPRLTNSIVSGNQAFAGQGGAIYIDSGGQPGDGSGLMDIHCCTFAGNHAGGNGGAISYWDNGSNQPNNTSRVYNSIFWGNTPTQLSARGSGLLDIEYCTIQDWAGGGIAVSALDPRFVDADGPDNVVGTLDDNLHPGTGSPAIDSGSTFILPPDTYDLNANGNTQEPVSLDLDARERVVDDPSVPPNGGTPAVDRGAYESQFNCTSCPGDREWRNAAGGFFHVPANWFPSVPTSVHDAVFNLGATYGVEFGQPAVSASATIRAGVVSFELAGNRYDLTNAPGAGTLTVGRSLNDVAHLSLSGAGTLYVPLSADAYIGRDAGSFGQIDVADRSTLYVENDLSIGNNGAGVLNITDGGHVVTFTASIGDHAGAFGAAIVAGQHPQSSQPSTWDVPFFLTVRRGSLGVFSPAVVDADFGGILVAQTGSVYGNGTIIGDILSVGEVAPRGPGSGSPPGTLTIDGAYEQLGVINGRPDTGRLVLKVGGDSPGQFDRLIVNGHATLGGGLIVQSLNGFMPPAGSFNLPILAPSTLTGTFDVALFPGLSDGRFYKVTYPGDSGGVVLTLGNLGGSSNFGGPENTQINGSPTAAAIGLIDNDQYPDLVLTVPDEQNPTTANGSVIVLLNNGVVNGEWGGFRSGSQITVGKEPVSLVIADFNGDGKQDLAVANASDDTVRVLANDGTGGFVPLATLTAAGRPVYVSADNMDADLQGRVDLLVACRDNSTVSCLLNNGLGLFVPTPQSPIQVPHQPTSVDPFPLDNDKEPDITVAFGGTSAIRVMFGLGGGLLGAAQDFSVGDNPVRVGAADLDGDGHRDLVTCNRSIGAAAGSVSVILNQGLRSFRPPVELPVAAEPRSIAFLDIDRDLDADLIVLNDEGGVRKVWVLRNDRSGEQLAFAPQQPLPTNPTSFALLVGNVDLDQREDVIAVGTGGTDTADGVDTVRNPCYPNCDLSGVAPVLNVQDFACFLNKYAAADPYANCDGSTQAPVLNVQDFACFLNKFAAGCP